MGTISGVGGGGVQPYPPSSGITYSQFRQDLTNYFKLPNDANFAIVQNDIKQLASNPNLSHPDKVILNAITQWSQEYEGNLPAVAQLNAELATVPPNSQAAANIEREIASYDQSGLQSAITDGANALK